MKFFAESKLSPRMGLSPEGYLICFDVPIGRTGEQIYGAEELGRAGDGEIRVSRPAEEVFAESSMRSFEGKPVTIDHPSDMVGPETWRSLAMGTAHNVRRVEDTLVADLLITDPEAMSKIKSGELREISCGYDAEYEETGKHSGVQRSIVGNHIALVKRGRCGPQCAIGDSKIKRGSTMGKAGLKDSLRKLFKGAMDEALEEIKDEGTEEAPRKIELEIKGLGEPGSVKDEPETQADSVETMIAELGKRFEAVEKRLTALEESDKKVHAAADEDPAEVKAEAEVEDELTETKKACDSTTTTDRARRALWQDTLHRAAILAPGLRVPTFDSARTPKAFADAICSVKRRAVDAAYATTDGQRIIAPWVGPHAQVRTLDCVTLDAAFSAASEALARENNRVIGTFGDAANTGPLSPEKFNDRAAAFWAKRKGA